MKFINPKIVVISLYGTILLLLLLNIVSFLNLYFTEGNPENLFFRKTNFNEEKNAPSIFSSLLHFFASFILFSIGKTKLKIKISRSFWWILSVVFFFLGWDELLRIHEKLGGNFLEDYPGMFLYSWIVYYIIIIILLGIIILKPLMKLPTKTLVGFVTAGLIFLSGAIGLENITGGYIHGHRLNESIVIITPRVFIFYTIEELLEMIGVTWFIYSLLLFFKQYGIQEKEI